MNTLIPGAPLRSLSPTTNEYQRAQGESRAAKPARAARFSLDAPEHSGTMQRGASSFAVDDRGDNVLDVAAATGQESLRTFVLEYGRAKRKALRDALAGAGLGD